MKVQSDLQGLIDICHLKKKVSYNEDIRTIDRMSQFYKANQANGKNRNDDNP